MAIRNIILYPDKLLRERARPIAVFDDALGVLLDDMLETMYENQGIGLAGNQVGELHRVVVLDVSDDRNEPLEVINPEIVAFNGTVSHSEGCLSIPDYRDTIKRHREVQVKAFNRQGEEFLITASGLLAICLQHEIDHLDGVLFIDHLSVLKKQLFKSWCRKHKVNPE
jgi:peptide deformylase